MVNNFDWIKKDEKWVISNNNINFSDIKEIARPYSELGIVKSDKNKAVIYVPVHNIHDIYEWYRIFFDSKIVGSPTYTDNSDPYGFWIHGFFDKESSQSIRTYFPNLKLVKAATIDDIAYIDDQKVPVEYFDLGATYPTLTIDGVEILDGEYVLLKSQKIFDATKISITSFTDYSITFPTFGGVENDFRVGSTLRYIVGITLEYKDVIIKSVSNDPSYTYITVDTLLDNPYLCWDMYNAGYITNVAAQGISNGIYQYKDKQLVRSEEMNDEFKVFNQIVYCYQGKTQMNKQFYLRRIEDYSETSYSKFPIDNDGVPFVYSEGDAYLVKFEFDYDLDINQPEHPIGDEKFIQDNTENVYRLLFLDQDIASKIMIKDEHGIGTYTLAEHNLGSGFYIDNITSIQGVPFFTIGFSTTAPNDYNTLNVIGHKIEKGIYENYTLTGTGSNNGTHYTSSAESQIVDPISKYNVYDFSRFLDSTITPILPLSYTYVDDKIAPIEGYITFTNNNAPYEHTTEVSIINNDPQLWGYWMQLYRYAAFNFLITSGLEDATVCLTEGSYIKLGVFIRITIEYDKGNGYYTALDQNFLITRNQFIPDFTALADDPDNSQNATDFVFGIYPKLPTNFINEYNAYSDPARTDVKCRVSFDLIQSIDTGNVAFVDFTNRTHANLIKEAIRKMELNSIYEIEVDPAINYEVNDAIVIDIPGLIVTDAILAATPTGINSPSPVTFVIGELLMIHAQTDFTENGIYIYQGPNKKLVRSNILFTEDTVFQSSCSFSSGSTQFLYNPVFIPAPEDGYPIYGTTSITFNPISDSDLSIDLIIKKPKQEHFNKYSTYSTKVESLDNGGPIYVEFINDWEKQQNINNNAVDLQAIYGQNYSVTNYLSNYLGVSNNDNNYQEIDLLGFPELSLTYFNIEGNVNRVGFERNKIILGPSYKTELLRIHKQVLITIDYPALNIPNVLIYNIEWIESSETIEISTNVNFDVITIPSTSDTVTITFQRDLPEVQTNHFDVTQNTTSWRPDTSGYAKYLMNGALSDNSMHPNSIIAETATAIWYKDNSEPCISFSKRDKFFGFATVQEYDNIPLSYTTMDVASVAPVNIVVAPAVIDGFTLTIGDTILVRNNTPDSENGYYVYDGVGQPLIANLTPPVTNNEILYYYITNGTVNGGVYFQKIGYSYIALDETKNRMKYDPRLYLRPIEIAKLGVDNDTQPWQKVSYKYDVYETLENEVNIQVGINERKRIRFIDGLTEYNIANDLSGQGIYSWILDDDIELEDAVVGCTQVNGPGTGELIWYTGTWFAGTWVEGIWMSGTWINGTWLSGTWNSFAIHDYWHYVIYTNIQILGPSTWKSGLWTTGTWNHGTWENGLWNDGTWYNGKWINGTWNTGTWYNGTFKLGTWHNGTWNNGYFEAGTWNNGTFDKLDGAYQSIFGYKSTLANKAIWRKGTFKTGEIWAGQDNNIGLISPSITDHRATIIFAANIKDCDFRSGVIVTCLWENGTFHNGVWLGGYYADFSANNTTYSKNLTIDPNQYYNALGVTNSAHNMHNYGQTEFVILGKLTDANIVTQAGNTPFWTQNIYTMFEDDNVGANTYTLPLVDNTYVNDDTNLNLEFDTAGSCTTPSPLFVVENQSTGDLDGNPFIAAMWLTGTWKNGTWCNGFAYAGIFEQGQFLRGYINQATTFGINVE